MDSRAPRPVSRPNLADMAAKPAWDWKAPAKDETLIGQISGLAEGPLRDETTEPSPEPGSPSPGVGRSVGSPNATPASAG